MDIEAIRIGEDRLVPIRGGYPGEQSVSGLDALSLDLDISGDDACERVDWSIETKRLLDGGRDEGSVGSQELELILVIQQAEDRAGKQVRGRHVPGQE